MRQMEKRVWVGLLVVTAVLGYLGIVPARGADPTDMPATSPAPPTTQTPSSPGTSMPQGQMTPEHREQAMHKMKQSCGVDINKFCHDVKPGEGRIIQCLEQHQAEVSQECNQLLTKKESRQGKGH